jgi:hypothetical protein
MAQHYKDLIAWQKAMDLVSVLYDATDDFPKRETYSLTRSDASGCGLDPEQHSGRAGTLQSP